MHPPIDPFYAISISRRAHQLSAQGRSIVHMEFGQPGADAPKAAIAATHQILDAGAPGYWESEALRERIARSYLEREGVEVGPERILLTCGASPALVLACTTAFEPGDRILVARPGYVAYRNVLKSLHMLAEEVECGPQVRFQLTADMIAASDPAPDGVLIASPANPTGAIIPPDELKRIAGVCRERGIQLISDEIYHRLSYGEPAHSILRYDPQAIVINSFSKYFCMPGWRIGWTVMPPELVSPARARLGNLFLSAPSLSQVAALAAMDCEEELDGHLETYRRNRALLLQGLPALGFGTIAPPDGAFYIYASVAHLTDDSLALCHTLLDEAGVAVAPGIDFDPDQGRRFIRLSFAVTTADVEEALRRLEAWLHDRQPVAAAPAARVPG